MEVGEDVDEDVIAVNDTDVVGTDVGREVDAMEDEETNVAEDDDSVVDDCCMVVVIEETADDADIAVDGYEDTAVTGSETEPDVAEDEDGFGVDRMYSRWVVLEGEWVADTAVIEATSRAEDVTVEWGMGVNVGFGSGR